MVRAELLPNVGGWGMEFWRGGGGRGFLIGRAASASAPRWVWCAQRGRGGEQRRDAGDTWLNVPLSACCDCGFFLTHSHREEEEKEKKNPEEEAGDWDAE